MPVIQNAAYHTANSYNTRQNPMMTLLRERANSVRLENSPVTIEHTSSQEAKTELDRKIRSHEIPCPTCSTRKYKDESDDSGVSFKSARHIPVSSAGISVMRHEQEHVAANKETPDEQKAGISRKSTVSLQYDTCSECGRRYVSGGVTKTSSNSFGGSLRENPEPIKPGELDMYI